MDELQKRNTPEFKSKRRHALKEIDRKFAPRIAEGKAMKAKIEMANKMNKN